jgi:sorting nexin-25
MQQQHNLLLAGLGLLVLLNTIATTWLPSLRLIIWAFFSGCVVAFLMATAAILCTSNREAEDVGPLKHIKPLGLTSSTTWDEEIKANTLENTSERKPLYSLSSPISLALDGLLEHAYRDFINSWYTKVSPDPAFAVQVERLIRDVVIQLVERLQDVDVCEILVGKIVPLLTRHLHDFSIAEHAVRGRHLNINLTESEELDLAIASKYRDGKLHPAASLGFSDMKQAQQDHLRKVVDKILPLILPPETIKSRVVIVLIREIVACGVLFPTLAFLSNPDTCNKIIEAIVRFP